MNKRISKSLEEAEKKAQSKIHEKAQLLEKQALKLEEQLRKVLELETDIKQFSEHNQDLKRENNELIERC